MNSQIKQQWLSALRSGEYTQGQGNLRSTEGFCCLGVLCDLYAKETDTKWDVKVTEDDEPLIYYSFEGYGSMLPDSVIEWAGLPNASQIVKFVTIKPLAVLNDEGSSFEEIAQLIEEKL